jgi:predicted transcriptional regulator
MKESLAHLLAEIDDLLTASEGEITPAVQAQFVAITKKVDKCAMFESYAQSRISYLKNQADQFKKAADQMQNMVDRFRDHLLFQIESRGENLEGDLYTICLRKNPPALVVEDLNQIPSEYFEIKTEVVVKKAELKNALKAGPVSGARLEQGTSLKIQPKKV